MPPWLAYEDSKHFVVDARLYGIQDRKGCREMRLLRETGGRLVPDEPALGYS
jgi:hypothetical protein